MTDFLCVGDATQDNFFFIHEASVHCDLNNANCELILRYGNKIPVEKIGQSLVGNAANVSVGLARLGIQTALSTVFGDDDRGAWIKKQLMLANVNLDSSLTEANRESNLSSIIVFKSERTILSFHAHGVKDIENLPKAKWIYLTSSPGPDSAPLFAKILKYKQDYPEVKIAFNPYVVDLKKGREFLQPVIEITDILFVNKSEQEVLGSYGPKITAVTDDGNGAKVFEKGQEVLFGPAKSTEVVETTGAGDAFSSGFLAGYFYHEDLKMALDWALKNSASVVSKMGAIEGLLTREQISS